MCTNRPASRFSRGTRKKDQIEFDAVLHRARCAQRIVLLDDKFFGSEMQDKGACASTEQLVPRLSSLSVQERDRQMFVISMIAYASL